LKDAASVRLKGTVLLADDDPLVMEVIGLNLRRAALRVVFVKNGAEVLAKASKVRPDIILLSAVLSDMNGVEVCRRLKANQDTKEIPVVLMNSQVQVSELVKAIAVMADDYIANPLDPATLGSVLKANMTKLCPDFTTKPSVNLGESMFLYNRIRASIREGRSFAIMYLDIGWPRGFSTKKRAIHSKLAIRLLTEIVSEVLPLFGNSDDLTGHFEEDSLVVVTTPQRAETLCRMIISQFDNRIFDLFGSTEANSDQSYVLRPSKPELGGEGPLMGVCIAVVANDRLVIGTPLDVEKLAAKLRSHAKCRQGSNYYFAQQYDNSILALDSEMAKWSFRFGQDAAGFRDALSRISVVTKSLRHATAVIRSSIDSLLSDRVNNLDDQQRNDLELIVKRVEQLLSILDDLGRSADIRLASIVPLGYSGSLENSIDLVD